MSNFNIFDSKVGIQSILNQSHLDNLPQAKQIAASVVQEAGIEDVYSPKNFRKMVESLICPSVGDGEILKPYNFSRALNACADDMKNTSDPDIQDFLMKDLFPLLENEELLRTYSGLMIGG